MSEQLRAYSFTNCIVMVSGRQLENFGEGDDVVTVEPRNDRVTGKVGADGKMQPSISADQSAEIVLKFLANAPENDYLEDLFNQYINGDIEKVTVSIFDKVTGRGEVATAGFIPNLPSSSRGNEAQDKEWMIVVPAIAVQKQIRF